MQVIVDTLSTNYRRTGSGKLVLILHGWGDSAKGWQQFAGLLSKHYDVISVDLPGFGDTENPPQTWGLDDYAQFIGAFLTKLGLQPFAIIGHSNGGAIAIRGLASKQFSTDKLVLLASAGIRGEYKGRNKALRLITKTGKLVTMPLPQSIKKKLQRKVYETVGSDMLVAEHLQETFKNVVGDDVRADAARLKLPTLLVYGADDKSAPLRYGKLFHEAIKGSRLEVLPATEHFLHLEAPDKVLRLTEEFLG
jgi:pimeloyl-ACP methyl ester carboxylesterase